MVPVTVPGNCTGMIIVGLSPYFELWGRDSLTIVRPTPEWTRIGVPRKIVYFKSIEKQNTPQLLQLVEIRNLRLSRYSGAAMTKELE